MCDTFHSNPDGIESEEANSMVHIYGVNLIEIVVEPFYRLVIREVQNWPLAGAQFQNDFPYFFQVSNPFYLIQLYTVSVWMAQEFYDYASLVVVATIIAVGTSVWETRKVSCSIVGA